MRFKNTTATVLHTPAGAPVAPGELVPVETPNDKQAVAAVRAGFAAAGLAEAPDALPSEDGDAPKAPSKAAAKTKTSAGSPKTKTTTEESQ